MKWEPDLHLSLTTKNGTNKCFLAFGICDFMILNSFFTWNLSTHDVSQWRMVKKDKFYAVLAQELVDYQVTQSDLGELLLEELHVPSICPSSVTRP